MRDVPLLTGGRLGAGSAAAFNSATSWFSAVPDSSPRVKSVRQFGSLED